MQGPNQENLKLLRDAEFVETGNLILSLFHETTKQSIITKRFLRKLTSMQSRKGDFLNLSDSATPELDANFGLPTSYFKLALIKFYVMKLFITLVESRPYDEQLSYQLKHSISS
jgi:hypothetical protein